MTKIFTSDLHHSHKNIVKFTQRDIFTTQENHDQWLKEVWNREVQKGDLVYHLGDFSFAKNYDDIARFLDYLNGQKIFIKGNHDKSENLDRLVKDGLIQAWYHYKEIKIGETSVVLFHFPITSWHKQGHGSWHLHGHCHGNLKEEHQIGLSLDVGLDNSIQEDGFPWFYTEQEVENKMKEKQLQIADNHRENI